MNFWFAVALVIAGNYVVPYVDDRQKLGSSLMAAYGGTLLRQDSAAVDKALVRMKLIDSFFTIAIGWAWTKIAATECYQTITLTCPKTLSGESVTYYALTMIVYMALFIAVFHLVMERYRLDRRLLLVRAVEGSNLERIFKEMDKDTSHTISREELANYFESNGICPDGFLAAYDRCSATRTVQDADDAVVETAPLLTEFHKEMWTHQKSSTKNCHRAELHRIEHTIYKLLQEEVQHLNEPNSDRLSRSKNPIADEFNMVGESEKDQDSSLPVGKLENDKGPVAVVEMVTV